MEIKIQQIGVPNKNNRIYSRDLMLQVISDKHLLYTHGQIGMENTFDIDPHRISHTFSNLRIVDDHLIGDLSIFDTPQGKILKSLKDINGFEDSFRMAGIGDIRKFGEDLYYVRCGYKLLHINFVLDPA